MIKYMEELQYQLILMKKVTHLETRKKLVLTKAPSIINCRPVTKSKSNKKHNQFPTISREILNAYQKTLKDITNQTQQCKHNKEYSLNKNDKQNCSQHHRKNSISNKYQRAHNQILTIVDNRKSLLLKSKNSQLEHLLGTFLCQLISRNDCFYQQDGNYIIDKIYFTQLFEYLISILSTHQNLECHKIFHFYKNFKVVMENIQNYSKKKLMQQKSMRFKYQKQITSFTHCRLTYFQEKNVWCKEIQQLQNTKNHLTEDIKLLLFRKDELSMSYEQMKQKIAAKTELELRIDELRRQIEHLQANRQKKAATIDNLTKSASQIQNFVTKQENRKILKLISQDYKEIESDIYEYAVYLQSNELASNLNYSPIPFEKLQEEVIGHLNQVIKTLMHSSTERQSQKSQMMRNLILKTLQHFRRKDNQLTKLCDFKTKCIKSFVNNMKKWLTNWQLKQQFLVNLRKQFYIDSQKLNKLIEQLRVTEICSSCQQIYNEKCIQLTATYYKIEENYRLGNSFY